MAVKSRIVLGLNSGTSADGIDAAACAISGRGTRMKVRYVGHIHRKYPTALRERILAAMAPAQTSTEEICRLHAEIGHEFAKTAQFAVRKLDLNQLELIGSHGQTVCHLPPKRQREKKTAGTLQLGEATRIAQVVGVPVVSEFRQADMAAGGQGAPLVPWTDWVLFRHAKKHRILLNLGGIANLTWLAAGGKIEDVAAFDTGPGNMVIDALVRHFTKGKKQYDRGGRMAAKGQLNDALLETMLSHPFIYQRPPKSCGREEFGQPWVEQLLKRFQRKRIPADDWIATATDATAMACTVAIWQCLPRSMNRQMPEGELILCGGGVNNSELIETLDLSYRLVDRYENWTTRSTDDYGIPIAAKECVSFAMLAAARMDRVPANLPQVTGAGRAVMLGQVYEP